MTLFFANHQIQIYRNRRNGSTSRYGMSATFTSYNADIQPASQERTEFIGGRIGATFIAYVEVFAEVKEGDQLVTEDGKRYSVRGVSTWEGAGLLDHLELLLVATDG